MAQERNSLTTGNSPRQIERDIDATRADMSETLDAISDRFDPNHLKEQAMDQAKDFLAGPAADLGSSLLDTVKQHPVPALAAALSIGWLVVKSGESEQDRRFEDDYYQRTGRYPAPGYASYARRTGRHYEMQGDYGSAYRADGGEGSGHSLADKAGDALSSAKDKASDVLSDAKDKASHLADQATDMLPSSSGRMQRRRRQASSWLEQQLDHNPLIVGAVALATGALVGLSVPETQQENELMGRQSDRLIGQAKEVADEKIDQAKQVVQETAAEAKGKAKEVAKTAKGEAKDVAKTAQKEAQKQGLATPPKATKSSDTTSPSAKASSSASAKSGMEELEAKTKKVKANASSGSGKK